MPQPFELFPRTERQAKFVVISLALFVLTSIVVAAVFGRGILKVLWE